jgi:hypothetical protein
VSPMPMDTAGEEEQPQQMKGGKVLSLAFVEGFETFLYAGGSFQEVRVVQHQHVLSCMSCLAITSLTRCCISSEPSDGNSSMRDGPLSRNGNISPCILHTDLCELSCLC